MTSQSLLPEMQTDEAGCGESAGAITDWGFAGAGEDVPDGEPEPEYSDDEDFEGESPRAPVSTLAPPLNKGGLPPTGLAVDKGGSKSKASGGGGSGFSLPTVKVSPRGT